MAPQIHPDWALIQQIGPANLARQLGTHIQRVQNWKYRGIPLRVRVDHPQLFAPKVTKRKTAKA
jgi:hypothetical protein